MVVHTPEICKFDINSESDFVLLASDGIFDKLPKPEESIECVWDTYKNHKK